MLTMDLKAKWIIFNHKKVLRLMNKYWLKTKVEYMNCCKNIKNAQEHRICKNILNRNFWWLKSLKKYEQI